MLKIIADCLNLARKTADKISDGTRVIKEGSFGDSFNDAELTADKITGEKITELLVSVAKEKNIKRITVEGSEDLIIGNGDGNWFCIDPIDGSLNYKMRGNTIGLPFSCAITVLSKCDNAHFKDIIAAGIMDLRSGDIWLSEKDSSGNFATTINNAVAKPLAADRIDLGQMIIIGEMYYPENREKLIKIFSGMKGWLRSLGSAAYEIALVSSGQIAAFICDRQKQHELGAGYALIKGAGGVAVDFEGNDLKYRLYDFKTQTPTILAVNDKIAAEIIGRLRL